MIASDGRHEPRMVSIVRRIDRRLIDILLPALTGNWRKLPRHIAHSFYTGSTAATAFLIRAVLVYRNDHHLFSANRVTRFEAVRRQTAVPAAITVPPSTGRQSASAPRWKFEDGGTCHISVSISSLGRCPLFGTHNLQLCTVFASNDLKI